MKESAAIDTDLKTWANAQGWKLSNEDVPVEITNVDYDFNPDEIVPGTYMVTFSTLGRVLKVHTTRYVEEDAKVGLAFEPEDIHVMSIYGY